MPILSRHEGIGPECAARHTGPCAVGARRCLQRTAQRGQQVFRGGGEDRFGPLVEVRPNAPHVDDQDGVWGDPCGDAPPDPIGGGTEVHSARGRSEAATACLAVNLSVPD